MHHTHFGGKAVTWWLAPFFTAFFGSTSILEDEDGKATVEVYQLSCYTARTRSQTQTFSILKMNRKLYRAGFKVERQVIDAAEDPTAPWMRILCRSSTRLCIRKVATFFLQPHGKTWDKYGIDTTGHYRTARERRLSGGERITCPIA